ncbi:MAG TPA: hypothetical protein VEL50_10565 [Gemmatimonadales bacterium]|nr:hypothetical protein [Gemmatimonadales bacterium]
MDRREFLRIGVVTAAGLTNPASWAAASPAYDLQALAHPDLLAILGPESVREIGVQYRELVPAEDDRESLRAAILAGRPLRVPWVPRPSIAGMVRNDFDRGRTVLLDGWVLSVTEARQCALFSLLPVGTA